MGALGAAGTAAPGRPKLRIRSSSHAGASVIDAFRPWPLSSRHLYPSPLHMYPFDRRSNPSPILFALLGILSPLGNLKNRWQPPEGVSWAGPTGMSSPPCSLRRSARDCQPSRPFLTSISRTKILLRSQQIPISASGHVPHQRRIWSGSWVASFLPCCVYGDLSGLQGKIYQPRAAYSSARGSAIAHPLGWLIFLRTCLTIVIDHWKLLLSGGRPAGRPYP